MERTLEMTSWGLIGSGGGMGSDGASWGCFFGFWFLYLEGLRVVPPLGLKRGVG